MNKEYINNLEEGKELDELVAIEFMGWHKGITEFGSNAWLDKDNRFQCGFSPYYDYYEDDEDFHLLHWHPSSSYMWMEKVIEKLDVVKLTKSFGLGLPGIVWICRVGDVEVFADTAPLAVCKAALLSVL